MTGLTKVICIRKEGRLDSDGKIEVSLASSVQSQQQLRHMKQFMSQLPESERNYYAKINLIINMPNEYINAKAKEKIEKELNDEDMYDFCRFNNGRQLSNNLNNRIKDYRDKQSGSSCLHVASLFGNLNMMKYIIKNELISPNIQNKTKDTPLTYTLRYSTHENFEKSILLLARQTDLTHKDSEGKLAHQIDLVQYTKARVRIIDMLKEEYLYSLKNKND